MSRSRNTAFLGEAKIPSLMLQFSLPCVLSMLVGALYNIVDQIFIGNSELSTLGNAATGVVFPAFIIAQAFAWSFGEGCATYMNIHQGRNQTEKIPAVIGTGMSLLLMIGLALIAVFFMFMTPLLTLFGASENTLGMAAEYARIILLFFPVFLLSNMMTAIIRADGSPVFAMVVMLVGAAVNLILDPVLIFACKWGMIGAALATGLGQLASFAAGAIYFMHPKTFHLHIKSFLPDLKEFGQAVRLGFSTFVTQITVLIVTVVANITLAKYGALSHFGADIPIAVIGIAGKVSMLVTNLVVGIVLGCQPIVSYNMGAGKYARVKTMYGCILGCTLTIGAVATLLFQLAPGAVIGPFGVPSNVPNPQDYWEFARITFRVYLMLISITCIIKMNAIFFQAAGLPVYAVVASMMRDIVCFVPFLFIFPLFMGIEGVLAAAPVADVLAAAVTIPLVVIFIRRLNRGIAAGQITRK